MNSKHPATCKNSPVETTPPWQKEVSSELNLYIYGIDSKNAYLIQSKIIAKFGLLESALSSMKNSNINFYL